MTPDDTNSQRRLDPAITLVMSTGYNQTCTIEYRLPQFLLNQNGQHGSLGQQCINTVATTSMLLFKVFSGMHQGVFPTVRSQQVFQEPLLLLDIWRGERTERIRCPNIILAPPGTIPEQTSILMQLSECERAITGRINRPFLPGGDEQTTLHFHFNDVACTQVSLAARTNEGFDLSPSGNLHRQIFPGVAGRGVQFDVKLGDALGVQQDPVMIVEFYLDPGGPA